MKNYAILLIATTLLAVKAPASAQTCYSPITSWQGTYTLTGSGSGQDVGKQYNWTIKHAVTGKPKLSTSAVSCSIALWSGYDLSPSGSVNDEGKGTGFCPLPSPATITLSGDTTNVKKPETLVFLNIDKANSNYSLGGAVDVTGKQQLVVCGVKLPPTPFAIDFWPTTACSAPTVPKFALPPEVGDLTSGKSGESFSDTADCPYLIPANWNLVYYLEPVVNIDDDCKKNGGSSIGCQNQSLGEDVAVLGTGFNLHYEGDRAPGAGGNGVAAAGALMIGGWTLSVHHAYDPGSNTLFLGDGRQRNGYQLGTPVSYNGNKLVTSEDGSEIYVYSGSTGRHLQTLRPLTGALEYQFGYDKSGNLVTVTDANANVTTIKRDSSEHATAIVSPYGQTTTLSLDAQGFLSHVTDPLGKLAAFTNTATGLITSRTDENGNVYTYGYDSQGRLSKDADPAGGYTVLTRTNATSGLGHTVGQTTAMGRTTSYETTLHVPWISNSTSTFSEQRTSTWPDGLQATSSKTQEGEQISKGVALPDGTASSSTMGPDPRWGIQVPVPTSTTLTLGSLTSIATSQRVAMLLTAGKPFTLTTQTDTETINGRTYTSTYNASSHSYSDKSPAGREVLNTLDSQERLASTQVGSLLPTKFTYDSRGRLAMIAQGTRASSLTYDQGGRLASIIDPLGQKNAYSYDANGRLLTTTLADGRVIQYNHDANGNLSSITPPGRSAHDFTYSKVDLPSSYTPPADPGTGPTTYSYDLDRELRQVTRPDKQTLVYKYDTAGRLSSLTTPTETIGYAYSTKTGNLVSASIAREESLAYGYNGPLPTSSTWTGPVVGEVSREYNNNFWITSQSVNGGNTTSFQYDKDGLLTQAGALTITRSASDGRISGTTLGPVADSDTYNSYGELTGYSTSYGKTLLYSVQYTRDADSRIKTKTESIGGKTTNYGYVYDSAGRLKEVTQNGAAATSYSYDSNSNRLSSMRSVVTIEGSYDAQDRLLTYGGNSYAYTANGELKSKTLGALTTNYQYDVQGNLLQTTLASGKKLSYLIDPQNRLVGKEVNGTLAAGYLFDGNHIVAQLNGSQAIVSRFVYGSKDNVPDYMVQGISTYRIIADQLGSPRLVVNVANGKVAERIDYDEFGNVIDDSNPGFQPFGFAGGLYDQDTKLVRFGARDYDPFIGRWTAKDPIVFAGGDTNLYGYVVNDPVNLIDPAGLDPSDCACKKKAEIEANTRLRDRAKLRQALPLKPFVGEHERALEDWGALDWVGGVALGRHISELVVGSDVAGNKIDRQEKLGEICREILIEAAQHAVIEIVPEVALHH